MPALSRVVRPLGWRKLATNSSVVHPTQLLPSPTNLLTTKHSGQPSIHQIVIAFSSTTHTTQGIDTPSLLNSPLGVFSLLVLSMYAWRKHLDVYLVELYISSKAPNKQQLTRVMEVFYQLNLHASLWPFIYLLRSTNYSPIQGFAHFTFMY